MSLTDSLYSATYNPEAEKAKAEAQEKSNKVIEKINTFLDEVESQYTQIASNPTIPKWTVQTTETFLKDSRAWVQKNLTASEAVLEAKLKEFQKTRSDNALIGMYLFAGISFEKVMKLLIDEFEQKKTMTASDRAKYKEMYEKLKKFNAENTNPKLVDTRIFFDKFQKEVEDFSKPRGIWERQQQLIDTALRNPEKFNQDFGSMEAQVNEAKQAEDKKFSFQRFTKKVSATAASVVGSLFYVAFCITIGMLAANQAIGRAPAYRVLYFIYGAIFAPILVFYYIYLWFKDQSPKIYTLLPVTTMVAETTIGKFLLFPFAYKEDKSARDLMVEFLTQSAEIVGKTFDPKSLGSLGNQVEKVTENLKNLAADTVEGAKEQLPKLNSLRVNA